MDLATRLANEQDDLADARADQHEAEVTGDWNDAQRHAAMAEQCADRIEQLLARIDEAQAAIATDHLHDHYAADGAAVSSWISAGGNPAELVDDAVWAA